MHVEIASHATAIADLCRTFGVQRLGLFGSAAGEGPFDPAKSDADFLVVFADDASSPPLQQFFGLSRALEELLNRPVDLLEASAVKNPYLRKAIERSRQPIYVA